MMEGLTVTNEYKDEKQIVDRCKCHSFYPDQHLVGS